VLKKRSFTIARHRTSVALEDGFWSVLDGIAQREKLSLAALVAKIDASRATTPLASALRLHALADVASRKPADTRLSGEKG
jgi:predicted DNA-binding ribbon-helix-helix protein